MTFSVNEFDLVNSSGYCVATTTDFSLGRLEWLGQSISIQYFHLSISKIILIYRSYSSDNDNDDINYNYYYDDDELTIIMTMITIVLKICRNFGISQIFI